MLSPRVLCVIAAMCLILGLVQAEEEDKDHYPVAYTKFDFRPVIDNERLFKKYKECFLQEKPTACPRDVTNFRKVLPEIIESTCSKCLEGHIQIIKEAAEYLCKKRRADFDEIRLAKDPTGEIQERFEKKWNIKVEC